MEMLRDPSPCSHQLGHTADHSRRNLTICKKVKPDVKPFAITTDSCIKHEVRVSAPSSRSSGLLRVFLWNASQERYNIIQYKIKLEVPRHSLQAHIHPTPRPLESHLINSDNQAKESPTF